MIYGAFGMKLLKGTFYECVGLSPTELEEIEDNI
jgi:hypothetical protein